MAQKRISRFLLNEKFSGLSGLSGQVPNYDVYNVKFVNPLGAMGRCIDHNTFHLFLVAKRTNI